MPKPNLKIIILGILLFITLLAAYSNHFNNGFHFDDSHAVVENIHIRHLNNIPAFFTDPSMFSADPANWWLRSLVTTTLAIDYWLGNGLNPFYFQLSTFIWFTLLGVLLFFMYKHLLGKLLVHPWFMYMALAATAWFMLNTANAETVNYIIARSDVLSTFCIVASFLIYISYPAKRKWGFFIIPALLGVFAKETVPVLVILLFFYKLMFEQELSVTDLFLRKNFKKVGIAIWQLLPLAAVVLLAQLYTLSKAGNISGISNPFFPYLLTQSWVWLHYAISFFLPVNLSADTDWKIIPNFFDERIISGLLFVVALVVAIFKTSAKKETRPIAFGLIWFSAALLPTSLAPFAEVTNDHRMFFPFIGLSLSTVTYIGLWLVRMEKKISENKIYGLLIAACTAMVLLLNVYGIHERNKIWNNEASLWLDVTQKSPLNGRGLMNYGLSQMGKGNYGVADEYFQKAVLLLPYYSNLFINLGILDGATGKLQEADANFKKAISLNPNKVDGYAFYGRYLKEQGRYSEAVQMAEHALSINPYSIVSLTTLMASYHNLEQWDKLREASQRALAILPSDSLSTNYLQAAIHHQPLAFVKIDHKQQPTAANYLDMSLAFYNKQDYQNCILACQQALKLQPNYADAYSNIGASYNQLKEWTKAIEACQMALKIDPNHKLAKGNLDWAKRERINP